MKKKWVFLLAGSVLAFALGAPRRHSDVPWPVPGQPCQQEAELPRHSPSEAYCPVGQAVQGCPPPVRHWRLSSDPLGHSGARGAAGQAAGHESLSRRGLRRRSGWCLHDLYHAALLPGPRRPVGRPAYPPHPRVVGHHGSLPGPPPPHRGDVAKSPPPSQPWPAPVAPCTWTHDSCHCHPAGARVRAQRPFVLVRFQRAALAGHRGGGQHRAAPADPA